MSVLGGKNRVYLGSNAKSCPTQEIRGLQPFLPSAKSSVETVDFSTGEIIQNTPVYCPVSTRLERFALQSAARYLLPDSRTAKCLRLRQAHKNEVEVWKSSEHGTAHYAGLQTCSSVWACPVCAAKISERRRVEVLHAMDQHKARGGQVLLLTLTNPHTRTDDIGAMLKAQAAASHRLNSTRAAIALWESLGCVGTIRAWEVMHGVNGWHPHFHILIFCKPDLSSPDHFPELNLRKLKGRFFDVWANCCRLARLPAPSFEHGVDIQDGDKAAEYVSKGVWGLDREMTKGHMKKGKEGGRSPFDLLRSYLHDKDKQAGALFIEYADAFKGKRQLVWSKGLKALFEVQEQTDEETATKVDDDAYLLGKISIDEWRAVRRFNVRGDILELARHGWEPVERFLAGLMKQMSQIEKDGGKREKKTKIKNCTQRGAPGTQVDWVVDLST